MSSEFRRVESAFQAVIDRLSSKPSSIALQEVCGDDSELTARVKQLLESYQSAPSFLECPAIQYVQDELSQLTEVTAETQAIAEQRLIDTPATEVFSSSRPLDDDSAGFLPPSIHETPQLLATLFPEKRLGEYQILEFIGSGGMGIVVKARDARLDREVAIKVMKPLLASDPAARRQFLQEARSAAKVIHPNVVTIHAVQETDSMSYLVMEYLRGQTLDQILDQGEMSVNEIVRISHQAALGLAAAHKRQIVHRDVKPANILVIEEDRRIKITDFGLARVLVQDNQTQSAVVAGTPRYMSPEQSMGDPVDHRSDLFSLGSVMYELCTGQPPFTAESVMGVLRKISDAPHAPVTGLNPKIPSWLTSIIDRLLQKAPIDRIQSAVELATLLEVASTALHQDDTIARKIEPRPLQQASRPFPWPRALVTLAGLVLLTAMVFIISTREGEFEVTAEDPMVVAMISENGGLVVEDRRTNQQYTLKRGKNKLPNGDYELTVTTPAGLDINTPKFRISRTGQSPSIIVRALAPATQQTDAKNSTKSEREIPTENSNPAENDGEWLPPENLTALNSSGYDAGPFPSADGLTLTYQTHLKWPESVGPLQLWQTHRRSVDESFGTPVRLDNVINSDAATVDASMTADELTLIFSSERPNGQGRMDLWMATRLDRQSSWGQPVNLGPDVNTALSEWEPEISADGLSLCFHSDLNEGFGGTDLRIARRGSREATFGAAKNMGSGVNTADNEGGASLSADGKTLLFHRVANRKFSLMKAVRRATDVPFADAQPVKIDQLGDGQPSSPALSADGNRLYFAMTRADGRGMDIWRSRRKPSPAQSNKQFALEFDGTASHVMIPGVSHDAPSQATIEAWVWAERKTDLKKAVFLFAGKARIQLAVAPDYWFAWDDSYDQGDVGSVDVSPLIPQQWVHLAYVTDDTTVLFYVNGAEAVRLPITTWKGNQNPLQGIWFGGHPSDFDRSLIDYCFSGRVDEARISSCARYDKAFTPARRWEPDRQTVALYHFDEGTGTELKDSSGNNHHGQILGAKWVAVGNDSR